MNTSEQSLLMMNAAKVGYRFGQFYYSTLTTDPGSAYMFYEEFGHYETIFEDGTSIVAKDWNGINSVLNRPMTIADICIKSITAEPVGGSLEHLIITVTGERFYHVMAVDYRPARGICYAIVKSVKQYLPEKPPTGVTTSDAVNEVATNREPSLGIVNISTYTDTTTVNNTPRRILKRVANPAVIASSSIPSGYTVKNDACYDETADNTPIGIKMRAAEAGYRFAMMYYVTLSTDPENAYLFYDELGDYRTEFEDGTTVVAKNRKEIISVLKRPVTASDIFVTSISAEPFGGSLDHLIITVMGERFYHVIAADYRPDGELCYAIVKSVKHYLPANQRVTASDEAAGFAGNDNEHAGMYQVNFSDDIATSTMVTRYTAKNDANHEVTTENISISVMTSAADLGFRFPERRYASLNTYLFYDELGDYRTEFEDGAFIFAKKRKEINNILKRSVTLADISVNSVSVEHLGGPVELLLITMTGERSLRVPAADYRPNRALINALYPEERLMRIPTISLQVIDLLKIITIASPQECSKETYRMILTALTVNSHV